jgi:putative inorganic carbon (HCO3(-)) transporter
MSQAAIAEIVTVEARSADLRIAGLLNTAIFSALVGLVVLTAIPYGTIEPWWKAAFVCVVFALGICAIVEGLLNRSGSTVRLSVLLPLLGLTAFAFLQTVSLGTGSKKPGDTYQSQWIPISADPYQTRFFVLQLLALTLALAMLYRVASSDRRVRILIHVVIGVAVFSALFGILRQATQHTNGFVLPLMKPEQGYGQFINKNHFAFLMEMAFGLGLGLVLAGAVKRERIMIYVALLLPIWTGLVLSNSRGGILAMLAQLVVAVLLFTNVNIKAETAITQYRFSHLARSLGLRIALLVVLIIGILYGTFWVGGDRLVSSFEAVRGEWNPAAAGSHDGATRNEIWRATWHMFEAHPVFGVGLGGYWTAITAYHDASGTLTPQEAHNDYLELLASGGVVGFALGVWFAMAVYRLTRENLKSASRFGRAACFGATLGMTGVAVHSLVDFGLHMMVNALVFIILVMIATARTGSERPQMLRVNG